MIDVPTLLFTDVAGSRALERRSPAGAARALETQDRLVRASVLRHGGHVFEHTGDGLYAVLPSPLAAVLAATEAQQAILSEPWADVGSVRVRIALHSVTRGTTTGPAAIRRCGHLLSIGHGGQVLLTGPTARLLGRSAPLDSQVLPLGSRRRHPLSRAEWVYQLAHPTLPSTFPPLKSLWPGRWRRWRDRATAAWQWVVGQVADRRARSLVEAQS